MLFGSSDIHQSRCGLYCSNSMSKKKSHFDHTAPVTIRQEKRTGRARTDIWIRHNDHNVGVRSKLIDERIKFTIVKVKVCHGGSHLPAGWDKKLVSRRIGPIDHLTDTHMQLNLNILIMFEIFSKRCGSLNSKRDSRFVECDMSRNVAFSNSTTSSASHASVNC
jgi:hypothetical protein